jgi:tetratricopeptide (TPR) repeat protein
MLFTLRRCSLSLWAILILLITFQVGVCQGEDVTDGETDPVKLFERAQNAHAKNDVARALALYEAAIKLRPEFPEAEYQRGVALVALDRSAEAEKAFTRAIELKKDWGLPQGAMGNLLAHLTRDKEAEPFLRRAIQLGVKDYVTLDSLSAVRFRAGDKTEALTLSRGATDDENASALSWAWRGAMERATGERTAALSSLAQALKIDQRCVAALSERAEVYIDAGAYEKAADDLKTALALKPRDREISLRLARVYQLDNKPEEMRRVYESLGSEVNGPGISSGQSKDAQGVIGSNEDIAAANSDDPKIAEPALEKLIAANPKNAPLLARLGEVTRRSNPQKSAESYRQANEIDPRNPKYATGYAAALVQARRFAEAVAILQRVISQVPDDYVAHTNLALALYELKNFAEALPVYEWLAAKHPEVAATYFFIATAHDNLGEYEQALDAYQMFLAHADPVNNKLDIEKVNLRLPVLRDQIKRGQGAKRKKP